MDAEKFTIFFSKYDANMGDSKSSLEDILSNDSEMKFAQDRIDAVPRFVYYPRP